MKQMATTKPARPAAATALLSAALAGCALHAQVPTPQNSDPRGHYPHNGQRPQPAPPSTLPPTPPTSAPATPAANTLVGPLAATPLNAAGTTSTRPHRAEVTFDNGLLNVRANDSSLNQILRAISRQTGLTITGGVTDQRVFGDYGPASTSAVIATLLDGTGTNMLLTAGDAHTPPELVLTPRGGGPTPPSPRSVADDSIADAPAQPTPPTVAATPVAATPRPAVAQQPVIPAGLAQPGNPIPPNNVLGSQYNTTPTASEIPTAHSVGLDTLSAPSTTPSVNGIVDSPNPPTGATPAPAAAPGALTPEAVYQQLLQMQKQGQQPTTNPAAPPPR